MHTVITKYIKITDSEGYEWIGVGESYRVYGETINGVLIKVFGNQFHVCNGDFKYITEEEYLE